MAVKIFSALAHGFECSTIEVEAEIVNGLPSMEIVGLGDMAVKEARQRVYTAIKNSGAEFPKRRKIINLAPAHLRKYGAGFDFPIAVALLVASGALSQNLFDKSMFVGELALDGSVRRVQGVLPIVMHAQKEGFQKIFVPAANAKEAGLVSGIDIFPIEHLRSLVSKQNMKPMAHFERKRNESGLADISLEDIQGQEHAKRALLIAAAGGHHLLLRGPPGGGKTMLARALQSILPPMNYDESLEVTKLYSLAGLLDEANPWVENRPFRMVHHTASLMSLVGGGQHSKPGEISLAHRGVLFFDEMTEFPRALLEVIRQPVEDGTITLHRFGEKTVFPSRFQLVGAMNPCPCGYSGDQKKVCACSPKEIHRYKRKLSGPIMDRMDLLVEVSRLSFEKISEKINREETKIANAIVSRARDIQEKRFQGLPLYMNSEMSSRHTRIFCRLDSAPKKLLKNAVENFHLSPRRYFRILKTARTIADLDMEEHIHERHIAEALQYRFPE